MRFNEFNVTSHNTTQIDEASLGDIGRGVGGAIRGAAKGLGAIAGGAAGTLSAAHQGYQAGKAFMAGQYKPSHSQYIQAPRQVTSNNVIDVISALPRTQQLAIMKSLSQRLDQQPIEEPTTTKRTRTAPQTPPQAEPSSQVDNVPPTQPSTTSRTRTKQEPTDVVDKDISIPDTTPKSTRKKTTQTTPDEVPDKDIVLPTDEKPVRSHTKKTSTVQSLKHDIDTPTITPVRDEPVTPSPKSDMFKGAAGKQGKRTAKDAYSDFAKSHGSEEDVPPADQKFAEPSVTQSDPTIFQNTSSKKGKRTQADVLSDFEKANGGEETPTKPSLNVKAGNKADKKHKVEPTKNVPKTQRTHKTSKIPKK